MHFPDLPGKIKWNINRKNNPSRKPLSGFNLSQTVQGNKTSNLSHSTRFIHFCNLLSFKLLQTEANPKQVSAFDLFSRLRPESLYSWTAIHEGMVGQTLQYKCYCSLKKKSMEYSLYVSLQMLLVYGQSC